MKHLDEIAAIERRLRTDGIPLGDMLKEAKLDRSMWTRWRAGRTIPRLDNWTAARDAAERVIAAKREQSGCQAPA